MRARRVARTIVALLGLTACRTGHQPPDLMDEVIVERIIHGTIEIAGSANEQQEILQTGNGPIRLHASRPDSLALLRVEGLEVAARGVDERDGLRLTRFTVTSVDGVPVIDGFMRVDSAGTYYLELPKKKRATIGRPMPVFKILNGARIWLSGPLDTGPYKYGVIVP